MLYSRKAATTNSDRITGISSVADVGADQMDFQLPSKVHLQLARPCQFGLSAISALSVRETQNKLNLHTDNRGVCKL